jgi:hypothetical protein
LAAYLLVVALLALFFVLDRLDVVDAAGRRPRGCAGRGGGRFVAAAVFVYDLEAHVGADRRGGRAGGCGCTAGSACRVGVEGTEGVATAATGESDDGGVGPGRADWRAGGEAPGRRRAPDNKAD